MKSYPAVKIGRLGTQRMCSGQGLARDIIDEKGMKELFDVVYGTDSAGNGNDSGTDAA